MIYEMLENIIFLFKKYNINYELNITFEYIIVNFKDIQEKNQSIKILSNDKRMRYYLLDKKGVYKNIDKNELLVLFKQFCTTYI